MRKEEEKKGEKNLAGKAVLALELLDDLDVGLHSLLLGLLALVGIPGVPLGLTGDVHHARLLCKQKRKEKKKKKW